MENEVKMVPLNLKKEVDLPLNFMIPSSLVALTGFPKRFAVKKHDQEVPEAVREWMKADRRYEGLFAPEAPASDDKAGKKAADNKPPADNKPAASGSDKPAASQPGKTDEKKDEPPAAS